MKTVRKIFLITFVALFVVACGADKTETKQTEKKSTKTLYISAIPDQKQAELNTSLTKLAEVLSEEVGIDIQYKEVVDYSAVVNGFERGDIGLAWFGGLTGVQARSLVEGSNAVVQRVEDETFKSVYIASLNSGINSLKDYKGKSFTFGSESSTSGHLMPRYFFKEAGITPEKDFNGEVGYSGSHDKTIELVQNGTYDGGALNIAVWERYKKEGLVDLTKVKEVLISDPYYDYNFTLQSKKHIDKEYGKGTYDKIVKALLNIDVTDADINLFFNTKGFIPTKNENYEQIEQVAKELEIIK